MSDYTRNWERSRVQLTYAELGEALGLSEGVRWVEALQIDPVTRVVTILVYNSDENAETVPDGSDPYFVRSIAELA